MPLDEFKTQVLLMHSKQSTLDNLSSGFNDRYTVHCATSGSEALNTLVETPINVIVTAQDLPGMSGLEALREAKKRSPDTVGILLASGADDGLEALVGEEEVFKIVRDNVSSDSILKLVESATQQMRLMALAESANDTAADPDEGGAHIVMETSENGSTIISDGTGRLPALDPSRFAANASVGARAVDLLVLTKDQDFLETVKESSRGLHDVYYANTLAQADEAIRKYSIGVAIVDAAMVGDKVEQLTMHLRKGVQRLVSIVAGRRDDGEMLMDMINRGKVYRFLMKPVSPGRARLAIEASVKYHLEAPDTAFGEKTAAAAQKGAAKVAPKAATEKAAAAPKPANTSQPAAMPADAEQDKPKEKAPGEKRAPSENTDPPLGDIGAPDSESPLDSGLGDAFAEDDNSLSETVTGLISSVTSKFSGANADESAAGEGTSGKESLTPATPDAATNATGADGGSPLANPKVLGLAAAAVAIVGAALFWLMGGSDAPESTQQTAATPSVSEADVSFAEERFVESVVVDADALIEEARLARDAGQFFNPVGNNAIELYAAALAAEPDNTVAAAELDAAVAEALSMAETSMLESRLDDADAAIKRVTTARPDNGRLPFLSAQLSQMQVSRYLTDARSAIRENRFEDAATAITTARGFAPGDNSEIDAVNTELRSARSEQQVDEVLAQAIDKLDRGDLLSPANDNARYYYELVLSNDPDNSAARQGLTIVASRVAGLAQTAVARGEFSAADDILADARDIDADNADVIAASAALSSARSAAAERRRQAEADRLAAEQAAAEAAEAERLAQLAADQEAERLTAAAAGSTPSAAAVDEAVRSVIETTEADAAAPDALDATGKDVGEATTLVAGKATETAADGGNLLAADNAAAESTRSRNIAAISTLNRTKYVAPKYPRAAQRRNISGWVDVVFTVAADGTVKDATVRDSTPGDTFIGAALTAVEKWKFEPVRENGLPVEKRAGVRMMFALEN